MSANKWRLAAAGIICGLLVLKFFVLGPAAQLDKSYIDIRTLKLLTDSALSVEQRRQPLRKDMQLYEFTLADCDQPYVALQSIITEDPVAMLDAAKPLPLGLKPHVLYLGEELALTDRIGLKLIGIEKFIAFRLGFSSEQPASIMYVVLAAPKCTGYRALDWSKIWLSS